MSESLWNIEETDSGEQRALSQKEQEFLMTGDSGTYTTAKMERRVTAKAEKLPDRFQQLVDDLCLLHHQGYLSSGTESEIWQNLLSLTNRSQKVRDQPLVTPTGSNSDETAQLGFEIGNLLRMLQQKSVPTDLMWGIIVGLIGESSEEWETEASNLVGLFEELEEQYEQRLFTAGAKSHEDDGLQEERDEIRDVLREHNFAPAPSLVDAVLFEYTEESASNLLERDDKSWRADPSETDHPAPPDEIPSQAEMRQSRFKTLVRDFNTQTRLREIDRLAKDLREDAIQIQRRQWRGVDPDRPFRFIGRNGETQVQEFKQTETKGQNNMTTALRRLSYEDSSWVNRPTLQENQGENSYWEFTPYGKILYRTRVEHNCATNWIYDFITNPQAIDDELNEIISEVLDGRQST